MVIVLDKGKKIRGNGSEPRKYAKITEILYQRFNVKHRVYFPSNRLELQIDFKPLNLTNVKQDNMVPAQNAASDTQIKSKM